MPAEIPSKEPTELIAGDTVAWTKDLSDYPAGTWTLNYYLRGPAPIDIAAAQSGSSATHAVSKSGAVTALWPKGTYQWQAFVSSGSERYKVGEGEVVIHENPATSARTFETRSEAKQILDALMASQLANAGRHESQYQVEAAGRSFTFYSHADLITAIRFWQAEVAKEERIKKRARGEETGTNIFVRFG